MQIFKKTKKENSIDARLSVLEGDMQQLKYEWESFKLKYTGSVENLQGVCRSELMRLAQHESISAAVKYRDKEFYTKLVADETKELKGKKYMLDRAISAIDAALAEVEKVKE